MGSAQASLFCSDKSSKAVQKMGLDFPLVVSPQVLVEVSSARLVLGSKVGFGFASLEMVSALVQGGLLRCMTFVSDTLVNLTNPVVASKPLIAFGRWKMWVALLLLLCPLLCTHLLSCSQVPFLLVWM